MAVLYKSKIFNAPSKSEGVRPLIIGSPIPMMAQAGVMRSSIVHPGIGAPILEKPKIVINQHPIDFRRRQATHRGKFRVFNDSEYRFFRSNVAPPEESDTPFATNSTLPHEPADTYADGTWFLSVSFFNGVLDSGFLPLGERGETYLRLDLSGGLEVGNPPDGPLEWRIENRAGGIVRVHAVLMQFGTLRPDTWSIGFTTNGSDPAEDVATETVAIVSQSLVVLSHDLPAQSNGTTVKVRLQTRRTTIYSDDSIIKTLTADAIGPGAPLHGDSWSGRVSEV